MAAAAVRFASRIFGSFGEQRVLFIGAGEMIELCLRHFAAEKPRRITIANRTLGRAEALAAKYRAHNVDTMQLNELGARINDYDVVVSCTASPVPIVGLGTIERALKARRRRPMVLVDLAIPRDIEAEVGKLDDAFLYTLDDLSDFVAEGMESRQAAVAEAEAIISGRVDGFLHWVDSRAAVPTIKALRDSAETTRHAELEHALRLLARGDDPAKVLEVLSHGLTNKLLHAPTQLLSHADNSERHQLAEIIERIYQLKPHD
jgi:glutamyl-tRNA reductase